MYLCHLFFVCFIILDCALLLCAIENFLTCQCSSAAEYITAFATTVSAIMCVLAYEYAKKEYKAHKTDMMTRTLCLYNERYSSDNNIQAVLNYLCDKEENINSERYEEPSVNQKEMFLRFFEELEFQMEKGLLRSDDVYNLFSYYALHIVNDKKYKKIFNYDIDYNNWKTFYKFIDNISKYNNNQ